MVQTNSLKAWILAARPKTLTGAIAPALVGAAFAIRPFVSPDFAIQTAYLIPLLLCLLFAILMQIDANFINDYFDFKKGTDREDRLGPERACAQGWITPKAMQWGIGVMTMLSCIVGLCILLVYMQWELLIVGLFCVLFCFLYTTKLSYLGWGDLLVLVFFGLVPVVFTYYVATDGHWNIPLIIASVAMGLATDNLLMVNNYRDRHQDRISGKRTIIVRLMEVFTQKYGEEKGIAKSDRISQNIYLWLGVVSTLLAFTALFLLPNSTIRNPLMLVYFILHLRTFQQLKTLEGKALNQVLGDTARNIFLFGLFLALSVLI